MKLAILSTYPPRRCGIGIYTKRLADSMHDEVKVLSLKDHKYSDKKTIPMIDNSLDSFLKASSFIKKNNFKSILIEHEYAFYNKIYFLVFLMILKFGRVKINIEMHTIVTYHDFIKKNIFRIYNFIMFLLSNRIIVHTKYAKNNLLGSGMFKEKILIVPLAIPEHVALKENRNKERKLLCFGFIWYDKGTDIAVRAFGDVDDVKLKIVGSINPSATEKQKKFFEKVKNMAKAYKNIGVIDRFVSEQEKEKLYAEADFIIMPYRLISQSAVLTEVWSYGKIPVCSNLPPLKEEIGSNEYGVLFKNGDAEDLKNVTLKLAKDQKMQKAIKDNIQKLAGERSFKKTAKKLMKEIA